MVYLGKWDDPEGAERRWEEEKDDLLAGKTPAATNPTTGCPSTASASEVILAG